MAGLPEWSYASDEHVNPEVELETVQQHRFLYVHLCHHSLLLGHIVE